MHHYLGQTDLKDKKKKKKNVAFNDWFSLLTGYEESVN